MNLEAVCRAIERALLDWLGPGSAAAACPIAAAPAVDAVDGWLVRNAVPLRQQAFAAGRLCARRALSGVGGGDAGGNHLSIGRGRFGAPLFPPGTVGSIAHDGGIAVAVAGSADRLAAVGVDLHRVQDRRVYDEIAAIAFTPAEQAGLRRRGIPDEAAILFSAKEAAAKCAGAATGAGVDFTALTVVLTGDGFTSAALPGSCLVEGHWQRQGDFILAAAVSRKEDRGGWS